MSRNETLHSSMASQSELLWPAAGWLGSTVSRWVSRLAQTDGGASTRRDLVRLESRHFVGVHFVPGADDVAAEGTNVPKGLVVVEVKLAVHRGGFGDARADKIDDVVSAAVQAEVGIERVDGAGEAGV